MTTPNVPQGRFPKCPPKDHFPLITGFITDAGVLRPPFGPAIARALTPGVDG